MFKKVSMLPSVIPLFLVLVLSSCSGNYNSVIEKKLRMWLLKLPLLRFPKKTINKVGLENNI